MGKMRILAAGDVHGDTRQVKKLAERAKKENVDLVILTGDMTFAEKSVENLIGPFVKAGKKVLLVPGNHETLATADFFAEMYPDTHNLHGYSIKVKDIGIFGAGGANIGISTINDREMFETLKKAHEGIRDLKRKIMITHMHPYGSVSEISGFRGSKGITKAIKEFHPEILIHSHIHETEGIEGKIGDTTIINVGRKGRIIEI